MKGKILVLLASLMLVLGMVLVSCNPDDGDAPKPDDLGKDSGPQIPGLTIDLDKFIDNPSSFSLPSAP